MYTRFWGLGKAFDSIDRSLLWQKLLSYNINGKVFNIIREIYSKAKSCIRKDNMISNCFMCNIGVRQGDNLSPVLFALFINYLTEYVSTAYGGLNIAQSCYPSIINSEDIVLLKLFVLLYADDTIILVENEIELQLALNKVYEYCMMFKLFVNTTKTKIIVFSRGKVRRIPTFHYGTHVVEVVSDYVFLGITMNYNNKNEKAIRKQLDQGRKAQFSLLVKTNKLELPLDIQCNLFEKLVFPIMIYGCEIWGTQPQDILEIFYRKFIKKNIIFQTIHTQLHGIW